jgi:hypothetical protein
MTIESAHPRDGFRIGVDIQKNLMKARHFLQVSSAILGNHRQRSDVTGNDYMNSSSNLSNRHIQEWSGELPGTTKNAPGSILVASECVDRCTDLAALFRQLNGKPLFVDRAPDQITDEPRLRMISEQLFRYFPQQQTLTV